MAKGTERLGELKGGVPSLGAREAGVSLDEIERLVEQHRSP